ncbi:3-methyl-2-oxobutanoate hydroxymethyltransferase [bacterium]|nr:3-methyl-2-oxobutanoate hydroxymethyltransferase [bacterium]
MKKTISETQAMKGREKISMLTCYDYSFAKAIDGHVDLILVGDSLGNVVLGYQRTRHVTLDDMLRHLGAVSRGVTKSVIIADLPYGSYETPDMAIKNARQLIENGADAVKPEGRPDIVTALTAAKIPVMAHLGLLPQTAKTFRAVGRKEDEARHLLVQAAEMETAGAFSLVLECVPPVLAAKVSDLITIPTIGIGAGADCDGQVLVLYDMLGLYDDFQPKFVRHYARLKSAVADAVQQYTRDIKNGFFPTDEEQC